MFEYYLTIRAVHEGAVLLSGLMFALRAYRLTRTPPRPSLTLWIISLTIDTTLATAALLLATILPTAMFANGWLAAKLCAVVAYFGCAYSGLSVQTNESRRRLLLLCAASAYLAAISIARAHHPLGPLHQLFE